MTVHRMRDSGLINEALMGAAWLPAGRNGEQNAGNPPDLFAADSDDRLSGIRRF